MTTTQPSYRDPLIDEVRERKRRLFAQHGDDLDRLVDAVMKRQEQHPEKIIDHRRRQAVPAEGR